MAAKSKLTVHCQIERIEDNPQGGANVFINCRIGLREWVKELWLNYDRPISMEVFKRDLKKVILPKEETDNLRYVKQEADKPFTLDINI